MLRRISVLLLSALLTVGLTAPVALAAPPEGKGCSGAALEPCDTGQPQDAAGNNNANDWGSVASQLGDAGVMGEHSSDPVPRIEGHETPRDGLGNVARNDLNDHGVQGSCSDPTDVNCDTGSHLSDHGCVAAAAPLPGSDPPVQPDCTLDPQEAHGPGS